MLHASTRKLIDRLSEMTELGKLDWTESEDGNIAYATEGYSVTLTESPNEVIITSRDGKELERASAEELAASEQEDGAGYTDIVAAMTLEASRIARGTEAAISSLLAGMQDAPEAVTPAADAADTDDGEDLHEDPINETTAIVAETDTASAENANESKAEAEEQAPEATDSEDEETETELVAAPELGASTQDDTDSELSKEEAPELASDNGVEDTASVETTFGTDEAAETEVDATPETEPETDTESDVTEAVARLANEVNQRQDSGLDAAAASAVGAVALAAGLTTRSSPEEEPSPAIDETPTETTETPVAEAADAPAYIPFGLEADTPPEEAPEEAIITSAEPSPEEVIEEAAFVAADPAPEETADDALIETATEESQPANSFAPAAEPESEPETASPFTIETDPSPVSDGLADLESMVDETLSIHPEPISNETIEQTIQDVDVDAEPAPAIAASAFSEGSDDTDTEPDEAPIPAEPAASEPAAPASYSLSGIGAGFGLGALSAKTEASGIPAPSPSSSPSPEKVVIDATDDVLPELEGNLNVSLAESASAAVSAANAASEAPEPAEEPPAADSDILKPRTRFNPWD